MYLVTAQVKMLMSYKLEAMNLWQAVEEVKERCYCIPEEQMVTCKTGKLVEMANIGFFWVFWSFGTVTTSEQFRFYGMSRV